MDETHYIPFFGLYKEEDGSLTINAEDNMSDKLAISPKSTFKYSSGSDVAKIFRAYGWKAPTTYRNDYLFKDNRLASGLSK
jgi:hypothetical protein